MTARAARIVAVAVDVECPYCGESLPNPDNGAFSWRPSEVEDNQGERECNSCDQRFKVSDHLSSENASLSSQVESMAMRIESLAEELAKPEDVRLREVLDALDGRAVIIDGLGARVGHLLDEMDEWIGRAGEAERLVDAARRRLDCVAESMTEHAYQELASALESPPRIAGKTADFDPPGREYTTGDALGLRRDR